MPWDSVKIWPDATDDATIDDFRWKRLISRYVRQRIIHKNAAGRKGEKQHQRVLPYHKCMHFPKERGFCWSAPVVKVHFRWMWLSSERMQQLKPYKS